MNGHDKHSGDLTMVTNQLAQLLEEQRQTNQLLLILIEAIEGDAAEPEDDEAQGGSYLSGAPL
ncbi:hypothetical protein A7D27_11660 [Pseudomonas sp. 1D4]|uniref:hypothetical protein n=1 Tax=Pseudomonadaceae TaxID=135621 RepID=UPI00084B46D0|nr:MULTISPECIES: hypothetical protein [Pseudomonas]OEC42528.1 hypothetical protein A7D27_11660 [Pseudomonas sp. 1D4]